MRRCVMFFMTGAAHLPYLTVALNSLRRHWNGDVLVFAWPHSYWGASKLAQEESLYIHRVIEWKPSYTRKNAQEMEKMKAIMTLKDDYDSVVYLDADIIVNNPFPLLFKEAEDIGFCATQFCDWMMTGRIPRARVSRMLDRDIPQHLVKAALEEHRPSFNSGIFSCRPESPVLPPWLKYTTEVKDIYISGETSLHAIMCDKTLSTTYLDGRYNCSTMRFQHHDDSDIVIWHGHGDSFVKRSQDEAKVKWQFKSEKGWDMWSKEYNLVKELNLGGVMDWEAKCGNQHLDRMAGRL